ncbi:hypothetical protein AVEN_96318-1 [Araneus ventricosus]|uniref:Uncharacterized protein n=1 Tax=Araneus ventricosus TaxID=182803 RepID=A0A4Y2IRF2_ARAVE|nr:hypothetical protein AVEN_96318-1 [Araneus ventricosus]
MMMIGSSVDYVRSGGMRNVPVTKAVEHLYTTQYIIFRGSDFSILIFITKIPLGAYSYPPFPYYISWLPRQSREYGSTTYCNFEVSAWADDVESKYCDSICRRTWLVYE